MPWAQWGFRRGGAELPRLGSGEAESHPSASVRGEADGVLHGPLGWLRGRSVARHPWGQRDIASDVSPHPSAGDKISRNTRTQG